MDRRTVLPLRPPYSAAVIDGARDRSPVSGLTHNFYRYPARFSPRFVRAAIEAFSQPGDLVLDPFMGGGTTLVEALALGRHALGADISSLAAFVSQIKTRLYSERELRTIETWAAEVGASINIHASANGSAKGPGDDYGKHLDGSLTWRLRKGVEQALHAAERLGAPVVEDFARCVILRTAQWAFDGRTTFPSIGEFRLALRNHALEMTGSARKLRIRVESAAAGVASIHCLHRATAGLDSDPRVRVLPAPKLVLTSPPYPGLHVLYHRWQIGGGKETAAPFWIANRLDGSGAAYYTMGDRKAKQLRSYFQNLRASLESVVRLCEEDTVIVQVVAFAEPRWQLPAYLAVTEEVGLTEAVLPELRSQGDGRLWRSVPGRKWYAHRRGRTHGSTEVVLFHHPK